MPLQVNGMTRFPETGRRRYISGLARHVNDPYANCYSMCEVERKCREQGKEIVKAADLVGDHPVHADGTLWKES